MKSTNSLLGIVLATMLIVSSAAPAFAAGVASEDLSVGVEQGSEVVVTVTNDVTVNDTSTNNTTTTTVGVENATVTVDAENSTYAANETFTTDENGTAVLPTPEENVTVKVTAAWNNSTATTSVDLVAVEENEDEDEQDPYTFGQRMSEFIHTMLHAGDVDGPLGQWVSEFAKQNNPGAEKRSENAEKGQKQAEKHGKKDKTDKRNEHAKKGDDGNETTDVEETETTEDDDGEETTAETDDGAEDDSDGGNGKAKGKQK